MTERWKVEFRYYEKPVSGYVLPKLGDGWIIHYGADTKDTLHYHNLFEFGYCYEGRGTMIIGDKEYSYEGGCYTAIPQNIPHTTESEEGGVCKWEFLFVDINDFIRREMGGLRMSTEEMVGIVNERGTMKTMGHHPRLGMLIRQVIEECRGELPHYEESIRGYLHSAVIELLRLSEERAFRLRNTRYEKYVEQALAYIGRLYQEDIKVEDMARAGGLSESHFRRAFEECTNMRPAEYLNMVRIDEACRLLLKENLTIADVGYRVGFQTASSFNRNFKRLTGSTPLQWKLNAIKGEMKQLKLNVPAMRGWEQEDL